MTISDFRSDTVTKPTPEMRRAMAEAEVGDDVIGFDPTVQKLEALAAETMGKEAGLFCPSGTMGNSIAVKAWTQELQEVIVESRSHIFNLESTHLTFISRVTPRPLPSRRGAMDPGRGRAVHQETQCPYTCRRRSSAWKILITTGAARSFPLENFKALRTVADRHGLKSPSGRRPDLQRLDGFGRPGPGLRPRGRFGDVLPVQGLSAPIGSMLVGPKAFIDYGRRLRKALGGGMRQVGVIAAAGLLALTEMTKRLADDHARAKRLARAISALPGVVLDPFEVETNIIIFGFEHPKLTVSDLLGELEKQGIRALAAPGGLGIRMVTHKDVGDADVDAAIGAFREILA